MHVNIEDAKLPLGELLERSATRFPNNIAVVWEDVSLSYAELNRQVNRVANGFVAAGVKKGDPVGLLVNKRPEHLITFLACAKMGALATPINFKLTHDRIRYQFEHIHMQAVVIDPDHHSIFEAVRDLLPEPRKAFFLGTAPSAEFGSWAELLERSDSPPDHKASPDDLVYLNYTSGSTGKPKGALTTHANIMWNCLSNLSTFDVNENDVFLGMFSIFSHPHELFHRSMYYGGTSVLVDSLSPRIVGKAIQKHKVTWMMAVPSFYEMLYQQAGTGNLDLSSLRLLEAGGAFIDANTLTSMESRFGCTMMPVWGSTEATGVGIALLPGPDRKPGTLGKPCKFYETKLVDEEGKEVASGEVGEFIIKGPAVVSGYMNLPVDPAVFHDGWYHTQDLMTRDEDGYLYFVARRTEMIKVGGIRVYPIEIETAIRAHPEVENVVVVRADDKLRGEMARAIVVKKSDSTLSEKMLRVHCRRTLAVYQVPRIIEFWDEIPKLPNGKIDKKKITETPLP